MCVSLPAVCVKPVNAETEKDIFSKKDYSRLEKDSIANFETQHLIDKLYKSFLTYCKGKSHTCAQGGGGRGGPPDDLFFKKNFEYLFFFTYLIPFLLLYFFTTTPHPTGETNRAHVREIRYAKENGGPRYIVRVPPSVRGLYRQEED